MTLGNRLRRVAVALGLRKEAKPVVIPRPKSALSILDRFARAYELDGRSLHEVAHEAEARVAIGEPPGRVDITASPPRITHYSSPLEAALDRRLWDLELKRADAEVQLAVALDDHLEGGWGDADAVGAARALVDRLRAQQREAWLLAPIGQMIALKWALEAAQAELTVLNRPLDRPALLALDDFSPTTSGGVQAVQNRADSSADIVRFAARRAVAHQNGGGAPTKYGMACGEVARLQGRIDEWKHKHSALHEALVAERRVESET